MSILWIDGQAISATQLNTAFNQKMDVNADGSELTSLAGSGSTSRNLDTRFADVVNVLDYMPTSPDGLTDNTGPIQTAINNAAGKARVYFPPTTTFPYRVWGLTIPSNTHLVIDGTIFLAPTAIKSVFSGTSLTNVIIEGNGVIDGNKIAQTTSLHGIAITTVTGLTISGITIQNCLLSPLTVSAGTNVFLDHCTLKNSIKALQFTSGSTNVWMRNCNVTSISDNGILLYGGITQSGIIDCNINSCSNNGIYVFHDTSNTVACSNVIIEGNIIHSNGSCGINLDKDTGAVSNHSNFSINNNRLYSNNTSNIVAYGGIRNNTGLYVQIGNNQISRDGAGSNASYGISVGGSSTQIIANQIVNESQGSVTGVGIFLANTANTVLIGHNQITDDQGGHTMKYGLSGVCGTGVRIYANSINGMITSKYANLSLAADTLLFETNDGGALTVVGSFATAGALCDQSTVVVTPVTGFTNTIPNGCSTYLIVPAGTLANGTVTMPAAPLAGQQLNILTSQPITAFTLSPNTSQSVRGAPASLNGNTGLSFIYNGTTWYCISSSAGTSSIGPLAVRTITAAGAVTATTTDQMIIINKTVGAATAIALPASPPTGMSLIIKDGKNDAGTNNITITPNTGLIDGAATAVISTNNAALSLVFAGTDWNIT